MQMNNARSLPGPGILHSLVYKTKTGQLQLLKQFFIIVMILYSGLVFQKLILQGLLSYMAFCE